MTSGDSTAAEKVFFNALMRLLTMHLKRAEQGYCFDAAQAIVAEALLVGGHLVDERVLGSENVRQGMADMLMKTLTPRGAA